MRTHEHVMASHATLLSSSGMSACGARRPSFETEQASGDSRSRDLVL